MPNNNSSDDSAVVMANGTTGAKRRSKLIKDFKAANDAKRFEEEQEETSAVFEKIASGAQAEVSPSDIMDEESDIVVDDDHTVSV